MNNRDLFNNMNFLNYLLPLYYRYNFLNNLRNCNYPFHNSINRNRSFRFKLNFIRHLNNMIFDSLTLYIIISWYNFLNNPFNFHNFWNLLSNYNNFLNNFLHFNNFLNYIFNFNYFLYYDFFRNFMYLFNYFLDWL